MVGVGSTTSALFAGDRAEHVEPGGPSAGPEGGEHSDEGRDGDEQRELPARDREHVDAVVDERALQGEGEGQAEHDPEHGTEQGDRHGLQPQHGAQLAAAEPDGPQQPDLAHPLDDRQGQRVDDAEHRDDDREAEQRVDDEEQLVDRLALLRGERRLVVLAPMLAAIAANYDRLGPTGLRLAALDEVPAEVDERGREGLARYIAELDLDLLCTSYLWDGAPGAWDGIDAHDLEAGPDGTVVAFPMLVRGLLALPGDGDGGPGLRL